MKSLGTLYVLITGSQIVWALEDCENELCDYHDRLQTWILSIIAACLIGFAGIVPILFIPIETGFKVNQDSGNNKYLRLLLSFAVGGLLGDVFLHLLPEAWNLPVYANSKHMSLGLWVLLGMFSFVILEIMFTPNSSGKKMEVTCISETEVKYYDKQSIITNQTSSNGYAFSNGNDFALQNGHSKEKVQVKNKCPTEDISHIQIAGYLNLMANSIDNFTHGLAVAGSFLVGCKMGVLTTFAILIHEIPHEIGDFAILLRSGFHPWTAAKAQLSTATIGVLGVIVALSADSIDHLGSCTSWILPFTAGGFLNIALVNVLPDLLNEKDPWESMKQLFCICAGIGVMAFVSSFV